MNPALKDRSAAKRRALVLALGWCGAFCALLAPSGAVLAQSLSFTSPAPVGRAYTPASRMVLADFNGDGNADLATVGYVNGNSSNNNNIYLQIYLGDGQGSFVTSPSAFVNVNGCTSVRGLAAFGLDSGGSLNLALLCSDTLQVWRVANNGASAPKPVSLTSNPANRQVMSLDSPGQTLAITDLFGVGSAGVVVMEAGPDNYNHVAAYYGPDCSGAACTNSSLVPQLKTTPLLIDFSSNVDAHERGVGVVAVPQPGSTTPALVYATKADSVCGGSIVSLLPQPDGSTFVLGSIATIDAGLCTSAVATGDVTQDGAPALVLGGLKVAQGNHPATGFVSIYTGFSDGGFSFEEIHTENVYAPVDSAGLTVLDLNGDGNADIVVGGPYAQGVSAQADLFSIYLGNSDGTFTFSQNAGANTSGGGSRSLGTGVVALSAGNITPDGAPDLATIDLVGDGSGGVGDIQQLTGTTLQVFAPRSFTTTTSLTATTGYGLGGIGGGGGGEARRALASAPRPNYYGPQATTQLTASVTPSDATGSVQFFDATTQTWAGTAPIIEGTGSAHLTLYGVPGHLFVASYYGSATYVGSSSNAVPAVVAKQTPDVTLSINPDPAAPTDTINFAVYVNGNGSTPTGVINLVDDNTGNLLTTVGLDGGGRATAQLTLPVGTYDVVANYSGDGAYNSASSDDYTLTVAVPLIPDTLTLIATPATADYGSPVSATATLASRGNATPTGTVQFQLDGVQVASAAISQGVASATITPGPGRHRLQAFYAGDGISTPAVSNSVRLTTHGGALQFFPAAATTFAGIPASANNGAFAGDGGPATSARFHTPFGLAWDAGNLYIADEQNNVIRKVAADGTVTTVAGAQYVGNYNYGRYSGDGGPAINAGMTNPAAIALDSGGNLFIADYSNNVVRRVDAVTGIITTFAGNTNASSGIDHGSATSVRLNNPLALAFDAADNLYIADSRNNLVRKVDPSGNLTTVAGHYGYYGAPTYGGPATNSPLNQPGGVAVDAAGNLYIADTANNVISKVDTSGIVTVFAGGSSAYAPNQGDGGLATAATLNRPGHLVIDAAGNLYITDTINNTVRKVDRSGIITTVAGSTSIPSGGPYDPAGTPATSAPLIANAGVAVDGSGNLYVANTGDQTVWRVGPAGALVFGPQTTGTASDAQIITVENNGDQAVLFNATPFTITGDYLLTSEGSAPCVFTSALAPGASCTIAVRYKPAASPGNGSIVFATNGPGSPTINLIANTSWISTAVDLQLYPGDIEIGQDLLLYAGVNGAANKPAPGGTFSFFEGTTLLATSQATAGSGASNGYTYIHNLPLGGHDFTVTYSGDNLYAGSTSASQHMEVTKIATSLALVTSNSTPAYGDSVTLTATLTQTSSGAPLTQGAIVFTDGSRTLATVNVDANGVATYTTTSLAGGSHTLQAQYAGLGNYAATASNTISLQVSGGGGGGGGGPLLEYAIQASGLPVVIHRGETATLQLTVISLGNSPGSVPLSCGTLPSYAMCTFSPALLTFNGQSGQQQTVTWTIQTTPLTAGAQSQSALQIRQGAGRQTPRVTVKR